MVLFMSRPTRRSGSRHAQFQRRVPAAVLEVARGKRVAIELPPENADADPIRIIVTLGDALRISLRTEEKALREVRHAAVVQQLERAYQAILNGPRDLTNRERIAFSGILYHDLAAGFEEEPISAEWWKIVSDVAHHALTAPTLTIDTFPNEGRLWGCRVTKTDDIPIVKIAPAEDGGTIKNAGSERDVPLHDAIINRGFLKFVETRKGGPLFYGGKAAVARPRKSKTAGHASDGAINRVREWVRDNGFTDARKAPSHSFRHWFKTKCADLDIQDSVADAIQGHSDQSAAAGYRKISLAKMAEAIRKISVPQNANASNTSQHDHAGSAPLEQSSPTEGK